MHYRVDAPIPWPVDTVHTVMRDRIQRLAAYLPGVEAVERLPSPPNVNKHRWTLSRDALPPGVGPRLPDDALGFIDELTWTGRRATFAVTPLLHADAVHFSGWVALHDDGYDTLVEVEGDFRLTEAARAKMPEMLRGRGMNTLEAAVISRVRAHVLLACRAVDELLDDEI